VLNRGEIFTGFIYQTVIQFEETGIVPDKCAKANWLTQLNFV
jgi:hypothetical protein